MSPIQYIGKIYIDGMIPNDIEKKVLDYFEEYETEYCAAPIIRPEKSYLFFSIPFDNHCKIERFEKEIMKFLSLVELLGGFKVKCGYINAFELFDIEDPVQYKYLLKEKDGKLSIMKQVFKRDAYVTMKNYLKKSTNENELFYQTLFS
jgi:hypothetical protein